jgi:hypothetical protein
VGGGAGGIGTGKQLGHAVVSIPIAWVATSCTADDEALAIVPGGIPSTVASMDSGSFPSMELAMIPRTCRYITSAIDSLTENHRTVVMCRKNKVTAIKHNTTGTPVYHQMSVVGVVSNHPKSVRDIHARNAISAIAAVAILLSGVGVVSIGHRFYRTEGLIKRCYARGVVSIGHRFYRTEGFIKRCYAKLHYIDRRLRKVQRLIKRCYAKLHYIDKRLSERLALALGAWRGMRGGESSSSKLYCSFLYLSGLESMFTNVSRNSRSSVARYRPESLSRGGESNRLNRDSMSAFT